MRKKIIIVGGVAGGASAAARLRRLDEEAEIIMFERDEYISFANCGLPYYIGESIKDRSKLVLQTPEMMKKRFNVDVRTHSEVVKVDADHKKVTVRHADNEVYEETYDYLVLSPGAKPLKPPVPGIQSSRIMTLRNIPDTDRIKQAVSQASTKSAVVIGAGFIGIEMAENLAHLGIDVTIVQHGAHVLAPFDDDMVVIAENELKAHGIHLVLGEKVEAFEESEDHISLCLQSGKRLEADLVVLSIGVQPDTAFLRDSGIELTDKGYVVVDSHMRTNLEGIYALGDAVEVVHFVNGQKAAIALAGPANKQGRIVADHICGLPSAYRGAQGTSILKIFDLTGACTGFTERTLQSLHIPHHVVHVHPSSHASYYPGSSPISLKLIFGPQGEILGAQAIGKEGTDKRIDVIATVMRLKGTVSDLVELELCYAPPFSSAKDPVNMAGFVAENVLAGRTEVVLPAEFKQFNPETMMLVDVRTPLEHAGGALSGSTNIPIDDLRQRLDELDRDKEIWVYCQVGFRGYLASCILKQKGFKVKNLSGGYKTFSLQENRVEKALEPIR